MNRVNIHEWLMKNRLDLPENRIIPERNSDPHIRRFCDEAEYATVANIQECIRWYWFAV